MKNKKSAKDIAFEGENILITDIRVTEFIVSVIERAGQYIGKSNINLADYSTHYNTTAI